MNRYLAPALALLLVFSVQAQENLIKNGDFNDSTGGNWSLAPNGAQATGVIEKGCYLITIEKPGAWEAAPQLSQRGFNLEAGEGYTLSFNVSGQKNGSIKVAIEGYGGITYTDTSSMQIPVTENMVTHTATFFAQRSTENSRLIFNCGISDSLTRITLDSVSLMKCTRPIIRIITPSVETRWVAGAERQIVWQNSGSLKQVNIRFSPDSGKTWSVVTSAASNQKSYWWNVPASTAGNYCLIIVSDTAGSSADTSLPFRIVAPGAIDPGEMVKNGDFLDTTNWHFSSNGNAKARGCFGGDEYVITIDTAGTAPWHVKLEQPGFTLENGSMYRFSFDAYASHPCRLYANVGADNGNPAWSIYGGDTIPVNLDTGKKRFTHMIVMTYPTSDNNRVEFNCGTDTGTIHIDNVSLIHVEAADAFILNPSPGLVLKSGTRFTIEWQTARAAAVDLDYSIDSGATWTAILDNIENTGTLVWNVPVKSSEHCLIRILKAGTDSVLGMSALFQINKFGTIIKTGEMVTNGSFTNNQQGWNTSFDNAQGQPDFNDQRFGIAITEPGTGPGSIILSQTGMPLLGNREYTLSFDVFANGIRDLGISLVADDTLRLFDTTTTLPSVNERRSFRFTSGYDAVVRLEFRMGGSRVGVFIDNVSLFTGSDPNALGTISTRHRAGTNVAFDIKPTGAGAAFTTAYGTCGSISIFSLQGVLVRTFAAADRVVWDGRNTHGAVVARGSYIARLAGISTRLYRSFVLR